MKLSIKLAFLAMSSLLVMSCSDSAGGKNKKDIAITFMAHAGSTHLSCGDTINNLGTENSSAVIEDFRIFVHDAKLIDEDGDSYAIKLKDNDWQTENVSLLSFMGKSPENCPTNSGSDIETNTELKGTYSAPSDAVITGVSFKIGVPFDLNHQDPTQADSPLDSLSMHWNWQGGYRHFVIDAIVGGDTEFLFHLGSVGCDGDSETGGTTSCERNNRPTIELDNFDIEMSAVQIDFEALVAELDISNTTHCDSFTGIPECSEIFDAIGMDYYDGSYNAIPQATAGQTVFSAVMNHN